MNKTLQVCLRNSCFLCVTALLIGSISSCKKDKNDPTPDPGDLVDKVAYIISGNVTDDENTPLANVAVTMTGKQSKSANSDVKGAFKFDLGDNSANATGDYKLEFQLEGHKKVATTISVKEIKNGTADYAVNAMLAKAIEAPVIEYKTPVYALQVEIKGVSGNNTLKVVVKDKDNKEVKNTSEASFSISDLTPGLYSISAEATDFTKIVGDILVNEVPKQVKAEGEAETFTVETKASYTMVALDPLAPASYMISGKIQDTKGAMISQATITLTSTSTAFKEQTWTAGEYEATIPANAIKDVYFTLSVAAEGFYEYSTTFKLNEIEAGQSLSQIINVVMSPLPDENEIKYVTVKATATNFAAQAEEIGMTVETTEDDKQVATITKPSAIVIEPIVTTQTKANGKEEKVEDKISFGADDSKELVIEYPAGTTNNALTFNRKVADENQLNDKVADKPEEAVKSPVVERIYEGAPSGVKFSIPVQISFPAPYVATGIGATGVKMNLLYEKDGDWVADEDNYVELNDKGHYVANVHHFSSFAPGFETHIGAPTSTTQKETSEKYSGKSFKEEDLQLTAMVEMGMIYDGKTALEVVNTALSGKAEAARKYVAGLLEAKIKADNAGVFPTNNAFGEKKPKVINFKADKQYTIQNLELTTTYTVKAYTITVEGSDITVTVKKATAYSVKVNYTQEHSGHGSDLNAGGGIVDFE